MASTLDRMTPDEVRAAWRTVAERLAVTDAYSRPETYSIRIPNASTARLVEYWVHGKGAREVRWGTDGSMKRCIRHLRDKVRDPGGLCAELHRAATGQWPTEGGKAGIPS